MHPHMALLRPIAARSFHGVNLCSAVSISGTCSNEDRRTAACALRYDIRRAQEWMCLVPILSTLQHMSTGSWPWLVQFDDSPYWPLTNACYRFCFNLTEYSPHEVSNITSILLF
jgi:hypothetical protein